MKKSLITIVEMLLLYITTILLCYVLNFTDTIIGSLFFVLISAIISIVMVIMERKFLKFPGREKLYETVYDGETSQEIDATILKLAKKRKLINEIIYSVVIIVLFVALFSFRFSARAFSTVQLDEVLFWFIVPQAKSPSFFWVRYFFQAIIPSLISGGLLIGIRAAILNSKKISDKIYSLLGKTHNITRTLTKISAFGILIPAFGIYGINPEFWRDGYMYTQNSSFIEENFVNPTESKISFPNGRRNLIIIELESYESSYTNKENGGAFDQNLTPKLTELANENVNFSSTDKIGGAIMLPGSTWTSGSLFSQNTGLPLIPQVNINDIIDAINGNAPSALRATELLTLGDVLSNNGYENYFMCGSDADFGARRAFFTTHRYKIIDYWTAIENNQIPKNYYEWWGYEDKKLLSFAKTEILKAAEKSSNTGDPFNFTLLTSDTHFPDGYDDEEMPPYFGENDKKTQYKNVIHFSDEKIFEFVEWIYEQDFYENTTIIILGDHNTMDPNLPLEMSPDFIRSPFNVFVNVPENIKNTGMNKNRRFSQFDMYPTILAAAGAEIDNHYLALGVNLFSGKPTIIEEYGEEVCRQELTKNSEFYGNLVSSIGISQNTNSYDKPFVS